MPSKLPATRAARVIGALLLCAACRSDEHGAPPEVPRTTRSRAAATQAPPAADAGGVERDRGARPAFPADGPWVAFYGTAAQMGDLDRVRRTFRIIDIDADPSHDGAGNFSDSQIRALQSGGDNRVLSYLNVGACERFRTYWSAAPADIVPCGANREAWLGPYEGYPDETWMNPANPAYQRLILEHVAPRLAARGVDGFYLDNLEIAEHADPSQQAWCSPECRQGALDLVRKLRERYPDRLLVMQNATGPATRLGTTGAVGFATLLDGVVHEEVYSPAFDADAERELLAWQSLPARGTGRRLFVGVEDYVGSCSNTSAARAAYVRSRAHGFSPYASDASNSQHEICYWPF
jgi:cysteinyl-tRNA synthetase, unknown class